MSREFSVDLGLENFGVANSCLHADIFFSHCSLFLLVLYRLFGFPVLLLWSMVWFEALSVGVEVWRLNSVLKCLILSLLESAA